MNADGQRAIIHVWNIPQNVPFTLMSHQHCSLEGLLLQTHSEKKEKFCLVT